MHLLPRTHPRFLDHPPGICILVCVSLRPRSPPAFGSSGALSHSNHQALTMAKLSLSAQLEAALLRANKAEAEVRDLKVINAQLRAGAASKAKARSVVPSFSDRAIAYCREHQCNSVPSSVVAAWRAELRAN